MIVRHRPVSPAFDLDRAFEQLTTSFFDTRRPAGPVLDGAWSDDEYVLTVDLPGIPADAVDVSVRGTTLSVGVDHDGFTWSRSLRLGGRLSPDKVTARHLDGRLTVRVGVVDEPEARQIEIATVAPAIEATSSIAPLATTNPATRFARLVRPALSDAMMSRLSILVAAYAKGTSASAVTRLSRSCTGTVVRLPPADTESPAAAAVRPRPSCECQHRTGRSPS